MPIDPLSVPSTVVIPEPNHVATYRRQVWLTAAYLLLLILVYVACLAAVVYLTYGCFWFAWWLFRRFIAGVSILALGFLWIGAATLIFMVKFLFQRIPEEPLAGVLLTEEERLITFIRQCAAEAGTRRPDRVFLTTGAELATRRRQDGPWRFFSRKREIILGGALVNTMSVGELRAGLIMEFARYSRRNGHLMNGLHTIRIVIYKMLYQNRRWDTLMDEPVQDNMGWLSVASWTARGIVWLIKRLLSAVFSRLDRYAKPLSRMWMIRADAEVVRLAGTPVFISCLRRMDSAEETLHHLTVRCQTLVRESAKAANIYACQTELIRIASLAQGIPMQDERPVLNDESPFVYAGSRVNVRHQWSVHPDRREREEYARLAAVEREERTAPAWSLFRNPEKWQTALSELWYEGVEFPSDPETLEADQFLREWRDELDAMAFPGDYYGYYDHRIVKDRELDEVAAGYSFWEEIFTPELISIPRQMAQIMYDLSVLGDIWSNPDIRTFDFDGEKYPADAVGHFEELLEQELQELAGRLEDGDQAIYAWSAGRVPDREKLRHVFRTLFDVSARRKACQEISLKVRKELGEVQRLDEREYRNFREAKVEQFGRESEPEYRRHLSSLLPELTAEDELLASKVGSYLLRPVGFQGTDGLEQSQLDAFLQLDAELLIFFERYEIRCQQRALRYQARAIRN